jgi:hypothetical protein
VSLSAPGGTRLDAGKAGEGAHARRRRDWFQTFSSSSLLKQPEVDDGWAWVLGEMYSVQKKEKQEGRWPDPVRSTSCTVSA